MRWGGARRLAGRCQARCEALDAVTELGERRVEAGGIAGRDRVGDGPVHGSLAAQFLAGQVAHGDDEFAVLPDVAEVPGPQAAHRPPAAVGAYIGAAYFFTSSTSFANPAITIGRMFSDTFAGIAPSSVPSFIGAQVIGGVLAAGVIKALYPAITPADAADIIVPHNLAARAAQDGASPSADRPPGPARSH